MADREITIPDKLFGQIEAVCKKRGLKDAASFIADVMRGEIQKDLEEIETENKLKGLGYIE
ncbi:MAG: hypothetical protein V3S46_06965 [Nitrospinota bacterium]